MESLKAHSKQRRKTFLKLKGEIERKSSWMEPTGYSPVVKVPEKKHSQRSTERTLSFQFSDDDEEAEEKSAKPAQETTVKKTPESPIPVKKPSDLSPTRKIKNHERENPPLKSVPDPPKDSEKRPTLYETYLKVKPVKTNEGSNISRNLLQAEVLENFRAFILTIELKNKQARTSHPEYFHFHHQTESETKSKPSATSFHPHRSHSIPAEPKRVGRSLPRPPTENSENILRYLHNRIES
jgi:hypothetical protein